ncbi:uncharacterized protein LOC135819853 isoform X2 [Sycon ciliatum]|uniref:uncharacterized protein LOC135819853 isoform X2 n=1 Tax=Sycon ciliatum TaxID=27933 RepID=UPI0031F6B72F
MNTFLLETIKEFDFTYVPPRKSIVDAGESAIEFGAVRLPANYRPPAKPAQDAETVETTAAATNTASNEDSERVAVPAAEAEPAQATAEIRDEAP